MYRGENEYFKRAIKRAYKRYTGERDDKTATIADVAKFFNILIDKERLNDYVINEIAYDDPYISIIDTKNNISYHANYTYDADLLNYSGGVVKFNSVVATSPLCKEESLYYIGDERPIITKMTFTSGDYELVLEKENAHAIGLFGNNGVKFAVRYLQNIERDNRRKVKQKLLTKIHKDNYNSAGSLEEYFEQIYTYGLPNYIIKSDNIDKYAYIRKDSVIYGINALEKEGQCERFDGICFEDIRVDVDKYMPLQMSVDERKSKTYPFLYDSRVTSALIFRGFTSDEVDHSLQVYKDQEKVRLKYLASRRIYDKGFNREIIVDEELDLPNITDGKITYEEIQSLLLLLQEKSYVSNNEFINVSVVELNTFGTMVKDRCGLIKEDIDPLAPSLFINKSFDEIRMLVETNKDSYFDLLDKQFRNITNQRKGNAKVLKP